VTHLRKLTLDEIARRNYTEGTTRTYLRIIEDLARYFHCAPDQLGPEHLREYTAREVAAGCTHAACQLIGNLDGQFLSPYSVSIAEPRIGRANAVVPPLTYRTRAAAVQPGRCSPP
jgi:hypothetical protein